MRLLSLLFLLVLCSCSSSSKTPKSEPAPLEFSLEAIQGLQQEEVTKNIISILASDEYEGRKPGSEGYRLAAAFAEKFLIDNEIQSFFPNSYQDSFRTQGKDTYNIVGLIKGNKSSDDHVVVCAHLDHIGKSTGQDSIFNGANDNASGSTAVLQVAKALSKFDLGSNIIVALFSAEETGLEGSKHLAAKLKNREVNVTHVFNFEMIGKTLTSGANQVYITGYKKSTLAAEMNNAMGFEFVKFLPAEIRYQLFSRSDNFPFYAEYQIPSHTISTFDFVNYDHYHKESDEVNLLDIGNMHQIITSSTLAIGKILMDNKVTLNPE